MRMFHGSSSQTLALHEGLCLTDNEDRARDYALYAFGTHCLHHAELDLGGLTVHEIEGTPRDDYAVGYGESPGEDGNGYGADVLVFADESPFERRHLTYRLMTPAALAAVTIVASSDAEDY